MEIRRADRRKGAFANDRRNIGVIDRRREYRDRILERHPVDVDKMSEPETVFREGK